MRLDDFWALFLHKPSRDIALQRCKYLIRTQEYEELAKKDPISGLQYLQTVLYQAIDRENQDQVNAFHKLATLLFKSDNNQIPHCSSIVASPSYDAESSSSSSSKDSTMSGIESLASIMSPSNANNFDLDLYTYNINQVTRIANRQFMDSDTQRGRYVLYNKLIEFLPQKMCQPKTNLTDFVLI